MDYVDWVGKVMNAVALVVRRGDAQTQGFVGVDWHEVAAELGFDATSVSSSSATPTEAIWDALHDLKRIGLLEDGAANGFVKLTHEGRKFPQAQLSSSWNQIMQIFLEEDQYALLAKMGELCQANHNTHVCLRERLVQDIAVELDWDEDRGWFVLQSLVEQGLAKSAGGFGALSGYPTYIGLVRATRQLESEWGELIRSLLPDWETTNVDFKRELNLSKDKEKAEFVRDILALTNTKSSGQRFMVIGFDPKSRMFVQSIDSTVTQDRLEDILGAYAQPIPDIQLQHVPFEGGIAGIIEAKRDPVKLPYKVKTSIAHIKVGDIFVRHGSHTARPDQEELNDLIAESDGARRS